MLTMMLESCNDGCYDRDHELYLNQLQKTFNFNMPLVAIINCLCIILYYYGTLIVVG